jgi:hypothetical protein
MAEDSARDDGDALSLLREWYAWWQNSDAAPAKMPDALHVRTAVFLTLRGRVRDMLAREAAEAEDVADAEERRGLGG